MKGVKHKNRRSSKKTDSELIEKITELLENSEYIPDKMTPIIQKYLKRYEETCSIKSKAREVMNLHLRIHRGIV